MVVVSLVGLKYLKVFGGNDVAGVITDQKKLETRNTENTEQKDTKQVTQPTTKIERQTDGTRTPGKFEEKGNSG